MKVYIDLQKLAISKVVDGTSPEYAGDINSNVFEILFFNYDNTNWFPTMSQLAPNGREAGDFEADSLGVGETHDYTEDGVNYQRFTFTMGNSWVLMKGRSNLYVWYNVLNGAVLKKCVGKLNVMLNESSDNYFISNPTFNPAVKSYMDGLASDIEDELNDKVDAQNATIASLSQASPSVFDTAANIQALTENNGVAVATDTGYIWYWDTTITPNAYVSSGLQYNGLNIADGAITKQKLNDNVFLNDEISFDGITFVSPKNYVTMSIVFAATGNLEIDVSGELKTNQLTNLIIGTSNTNSTTSPNLVYNQTITGVFEKTTTITSSQNYVHIQFKVSVDAFSYFDKVLEIKKPLIYINNTLMTEYDNIVWITYTPTSYKYLVTNKSACVDADYVKNYIKEYAADKIVIHNVINVSTASGLVSAINSIATTAANNKANKYNVYDIYLASGTYELYDVIDKSNLQDQVLFHRGLEIPDYVNLYGVGAVTISLTIPSTESGTNVMILSTLNTYGENHFENLNIEMTNGRYVVHDDDGGPYKNRTIEFKNCTLKHNGNTVPAWVNKDCIGAGYTGGRKGIFKNCRMECPYTPIYIHTSSSLQMTDKCFIEIENCVLISNQNQPSVDFQDAYGATNTAIAHINNSYLANDLKTRGTNPFVVYGGGNNDFGVDNTTTTPSKIYIVGNSGSDFTS